LPSRPRRLPCTSRAVVEPPKESAKPAKEKESEEGPFDVPPPIKDVTPAEKPVIPAEKKEEEKDPLSKNDVKEYRLWTDASGEFHVRAKFVGIVDGKVRLQKDNGRYVRIEMDLLCTADQRLIKQFESLAGNW